MLTFAFGTLAVFVLLAFFRAPLFVWTAAIGVMGATWATILGFGTVLNTTLVAAFVALATAGNLPALRRKLFSDPVLAIYRRILPDMSPTEKEAIDAGTVWWDADLFSGRPDWEQAARHAHAAPLGRGAGVPRRPGGRSLRDGERLGDHARAPGPAAAASGSSSRTRASSA